MNNTAAAALTATAIPTGLRWKDSQGRTRAFESSRGFGVTDEAGRWLSFGNNGDAPSIWGTKRTAVEIAATVDATALRFVEVWVA